MRVALVSDHFLTSITQVPAKRPKHAAGPGAQLIDWDIRLKNPTACKFTYVERLESLARQHRFVDVPVVG